MIPKTALQKKVVSLSRSLPKLSRKIKAWGYESCLDKYAVRSRNTLYCLECGHSWNDSSYLISAIMGCTCPGCGTNLKMMTAYTRASKEAAYFAVVTTAGDMQVIRMLFVNKRMKKLHKAEWFAEEVMQHFIGSDGRVTTMSLDIMGFSRYYDQWIFDKDLSVRPRSYTSTPRYNINPLKVYPKKKVLFLIRRNGFRGGFHKMSPHALFSTILQDSYAETLLKAQQFSLLEHYLVSDDSRIRSLWPSVKICIRNKYRVKDATIWMDYVHQLLHFDKDIRNPFYICPSNLKKAHDHYVSKQREINRKHELAAKRLKIEANQKEYEKKKKMFFGILISDGDITISSLDSVEEFMIEGDALGHCLFTNEYYKRDDSLILSAKKDNQRLETVEVSLKSMEVIQSRGAHNKNTKYHDQIVSMVKKNMNAIQTRARKPKKEKAVA